MIVGSPVHYASAAGALCTVLDRLFSVSYTHLTQDQTMIQLGAEYLQIIKYTCPPFAMTQLMLASLRTVKVVQISLRVSLLSLLVNCGLNYILISGRFGAPALGVTGAEMCIRDRH